MVSKEPCQHCRGNRVVEIKTPQGKTTTIRCPQCGGNGYKVRVRP